MFLSSQDFLFSWMTWYIFFCWSFISWKVLRHYRSISSLFLAILFCRIARSLLNIYLLVSSWNLWCAFISCWVRNLSFLTWCISATNFYFIYISLIRLIALPLSLFNLIILALSWTYWSFFTLCSLMAFIISVFAWVPWNERPACICFKLDYIVAV